MIAANKLANVRRRAKREELTHDLLLKTVQYDADTGEFRRIGGYPGVRRDRQLGSVHKSYRGPHLSYRIICLFYRHYQAHSLAYFYMTGKRARIDHKDGNGLNNRWENLRAATQAQNMANTKRRTDNTTRS